MKTAVAAYPLLVSMALSAPALAQWGGLLTSAFEGKLVASDAAAFDEFGEAVALDGDTAVVGAARDNHPSGTSGGSTYVYVRNGTSWSEQAHLVAADALGADYFGAAVAISGDTIAVGAYDEDLPGKSNAGAVYVFVRTGTTWTQQAKLTALDSTASARFGYAVTLDGNTLGVGVFQDNHGGSLPWAGAAYVFVRSGSTWSQQAKLTAGDPGTLDMFGRAVAIDGDTLLVGAPEDDHPTATNGGSAYAFVRSGTAWSQQAKFVAPDAATNDRFGEHVALSGDTAALGATYAEPGAVYVFARSGTNWSEQAKLGPLGIGTTQFAHSVSLSGDLLVASMLYADLPGAIDAGAAYVFARSGATWTQKVTLVAPDAAFNDALGYAAAASGDSVVLSARGDDDGGTSAGAAYAFRIVACTASLAASALVRLGDPPNPSVLSSGPTQGPVAGATWDPRIDHAAFVPAALIDVLVLSAEPANRPSAIGTVLCDVSKPVLWFSQAPGAPFALAWPSDCALVGATCTVQGASADATGVALTNALDVVVGSF